MKTAFIVVVCAALLMGVGCAAMFDGKAGERSLPVQMGAAQATDAPVAAWLELARVANKTVNPTSTEQPVDMVIGGLLAVAAAVGGWVSRHQVQKVIDRKPPT